VNKHTFGSPVGRRSAYRTCRSIDVRRLRQSTHRAASQYRRVPLGGGWTSTTAHVRRLRGCGAEKADGPVAYSPTRLVVSLSFNPAARIPTQQISPTFVVNEDHYAERKRSEPPFPAAKKTRLFTCRSVEKDRSQAILYADAWPNINACEALSVMVMVHLLLLLLSSISFLSGHCFTNNWCIVVPRVANTMMVISGSGHLTSVSTGTDPGSQRSAKFDHRPTCIIKYHTLKYARIIKKI